MTLKRWGVRVLELAVVLTVVSLVAGSALGQPILLSYVETGSMEPTLDAGDGFIAIPTEIAGPVESGDVVVFEAEQIQGGGLTTHRVVGQTERGFVTRGDANPFTDQDSDEPPVKRAQVVAKALQVGGTVVSIPHLGTGVETTRAALSAVQRYLASLVGSRSLLGAQGLAYLFFAVSLLWYLIAEWRDSAGKDTDRDRSRSTGQSTRLIVGAFALLLVVAATAAMVGPAGSQQFGIVSAEFDSERPTVIPMAESKTLTYRVPNGGFLPIVAHLEPASEGIAVQPHGVTVDGHSQVNATLTLHAPPQTGHYRRFLVEHRYLALLPTSTIRSLYAIHPWAPILAIDALIGVPFYLLGVSLVGSERIRDRSRDRGLSLPARLHRAVSSFY